MIDEKVLCFVRFISYFKDQLKMQGYGENALISIKVDRKLYEDLCRNRHLYKTWPSCEYGTELEVLGVKITK